ncbi:8-oxo-dGTP diphosphatase [Rhabdobacter roseus]|uniref:8-oxo-dGTP diphosphatase n=1 Tax=Rhabdobacter roseus TaxID=1655419 RepID=A0A840TWF3_9BACT|nr:NUDIX domain-containing protein [Rhabdobacter roseus]MBB5287574.1 8-oxo-dGTP diphosphatase [Rhabdobacter roseus]
MIVKVPCAVIEREGKILAAQRNAASSLPLKWEFPGGKLEENETEEEGLIREIREELEVEIRIGQRLPLSIRDDGWREIQLVPFVCQLLSFDIVLTEHEQILWLFPHELDALDWAEADRDVIESYRDYLQKQLFL